MLKHYVKGREMLLRALKDEEGASLAEYALLIALVLVGAAVAVTALTTASTAALDRGTLELAP